MASILVDAAKRGVRVLVETHSAILLSSCADNAPVAACDETVRNHFHACRQSVAILREVVWLNPTRADEHPLDWLAAGALRETERTLGAGVTRSSDRAMPGNRIPPPTIGERGRCYFL